MIRVPLFCPEEMQIVSARLSDETLGQVPVVLGIHTEMCHRRGDMLAEWGGGRTQLPLMALSFYFVPRSWGGLFMC